MRRPDKYSVILFAAFAVAFSGAVLLQSRQLKDIQRYEPYRDSLYLPRDSGYVELFSLGYDMIMADFLWLRSIQAFGGHWTGDRNYESIFNLFNIITDLDPLFIDAYLFGNMVIGEEAHKPDLALELINKGIIKSLNSTYQLGYFGGYFSYWDYGDAERARWYYRMATRAPDCPDFVNRILGFMELKSGRYHVAFQKYLTDYLRAADNSDELGQELSRNKMLEVLGDWFRAELERCAQEFEAGEGRGPQALEELVARGYYKPIEAYDANLAMQMIEQWRMRGEKLQPHADELLLKVRRTYSDLPAEPHGFWYFINPSVAGEGRYVVNAFTVYERLRDYFLPIVRRKIEQYYLEHGEYPALESIIDDPALQHDPFGQPWIYNQKTGELRSATFPDL
ncbi:MAG: hypothetical protein Kow0059_21210 [Candidatus Sumerlaeia bacterium]